MSRDDLGETYLGSLCRRGHDDGTGRSVRRAKDGHCVECSRLRRSNPSEYRRTRKTPYVGTYLGSLCKRGHDHEGTGQSLRYTSGTCVECDAVLRRSKPKKRSAKKKPRPQEAFRQLGALCKRGHDFQGTGQSLRDRAGCCVECRSYGKSLRRRGSSLSEDNALRSLGVSLVEEVLGDVDGSELPLSSEADLWDRMMTDWPVEDFTNEQGEELWLGPMCRKPAHRYRTSTGSLRRCDDNACAACLRDERERSRSAAARAKAEERKRLRERLRATCEASRERLSS